MRPTERQAARERDLQSLNKQRLERAEPELNFPMSDYEHAWEGDFRTYVWVPTADVRP